VTLCVPVALAVCLAITPSAMASGPSFTWTGRSTTSEDWSIAPNWEGGVAPEDSTGIGALDFPRLTSTACTLEEERHPCYISFNDVSGLRAESLTIDDGDEYFIGGDELTLGGGGLTAAPASGSSGPAGDILLMPFHLGASQTWSVAGRGDAQYGDANLLLAAGLTGSASSLSFELDNGSGLYLDENNTEVGPLKIEGANEDEAGVLNGFASLIGAQLNTTDGEPVEFSHTFVEGRGAVGAVTTNDAEVAVGASSGSDRGIEAASMKLDSASHLDFEISHAGTTAREDSSELTSGGAIELGDATLEVAVRPPEEDAACPVLVTGDTYTFVSTTGTLSGAFSNVPAVGGEIPIRFAKACTATAQKLQISYRESGGIQTVTGTVTSGQRAPEVTREPSSVELVKGETATFEATASGAPTPTVQWEVSTNEGTSWSPIAGATSEVLTVSDTEESQSGDEYRAIFMNSAGEVETSAATLTVREKPVAPAVTKQPVSVELLEGREATFEASASGAPAPTVQWEVSTNKGVSWSLVGGATSHQLKIADTNTSENGDEYRAVFTNSAGKVETSAATLTVETVPRVTKQPLNVELLEGGEATFEASASGVPTPEVQWEVSTDGGVTWSLVGGATSEVLRVSNTNASVSGDEYRAVFTNSVGSAQSADATLTVESKQAHAEQEANRKKQEEAAANKPREEEAAASKRREEEAAAKKHQEEEAARQGVLGLQEGSPDATIAGTSLQVGGGGTITVKISCPVGVSSCAGTVSLRTLEAVIAGSAGSAKPKAEILVLAVGSFTVPGAGSKTLTLHLSAKARSLLARMHTVRARVTVVAHDPAGAAHTTQTIVTLHTPKAKHGKH
jgi:hypothetical protein